MGVRDREKLRQQESAVMYNNKRILVDDDEVQKKSAELQKQKASQSAASVQKSVPSLNIQRRTPENTVKPLAERMDYTYYKMTGNVLPQTKTAAELQDEVNSFVRNSNSNAMVAQKYYSNPSAYNEKTMYGIQQFYNSKAYSDFQYRQLRANLIKSSKENGTTWTQRALKAIEESQKLQNGIDEYIRLGERAYYAEQYNKNQKKGLTQEEIDAGAKELAENPITPMERGMHFAHKSLKDSLSFMGNLVGKDDPNSIFKRFSERLNNTQLDASRRIELENAVHADVMRYRLDQFENVKNNADFAEKSKGIDESKYKIQRMFDDDGLIPVVDKFGKNVERTLQDDYISEEEQQIYNYIYNTKGYKEAEEYYDLLALKLNERMTTDYLGQVEEMTLDAPVPLNVASFATNAMSGLGYVNDTVNTLSGKPLDTNNLYHLPANVTNEIRTTTLDNYIDSDAGKFLYSTGMSMGDFAFSFALSKVMGVPQVATALMSTSAATNTVIDAKNRGLSDAQAYTLGTTAGAIEYVTEKMSVEALYNSLFNGKAASQTIAKNFFTEGTEEVVSSSVNFVADIIVSKDKSEWEVLIAECMKQGMSREKAIEQAIKYEAKQLALEFIAGGISGGLMGGGVSAYNNTVNNRYNKIVGNQLTENNQNQNVFELAKGLDYNSEANKYAYSANPKKSKQLGKLYDKAYFQADTEVNNNSNQIIAQRLADLGEKASTIPEISEGIRKTVYNEPLSEHERNMLGASKNARQVLREFEDALSGRESAIRHESIDRRNKLSAALTTKSIDNTVTVGSKKEKTKVTGVKSISENGVVTYNLENGKTATSKEVSFDNEFTAQLNESASKYGAVGADAFIKMYGGEDAVEYSQAFDTLFRQGKNDPDGKLKADVMDTPAAQFLNPSQSEAAYEAGRVYAQKLSADTQQELDASEARSLEVANIAQKAPQKTIGNVNVANIRTKSLTPKQNASIKVMSEVSGVTGGTLKMVAFESIADLDGQIRESNGRYDSSTNTIYFDINAGIDNVYRQGELDRAILRTGGHELTHFIQNMSPEYYAGLKGFIVDSLNSADPNRTEQLISAKLKALPKLSYDEALDEVIADSCEMLLRDSKAIQKLARENMTLAQKIKAWVDDFVKNIKKAFEGVSAKSLEAKQLEIILGDMTELQNMWDEALEDALRTSKEKGTANGTQENSKKKEAKSQNTVAPQKRVNDRADLTSEDSVSPTSENVNKIQKSDKIESVKFSQRDSDGNKLSENQIEYFKDSKVRDENGNLLVMYHGTPHDFTVFKNRGSGMYFTADPEYAYGYTQLSGKVMKVYLNITKPFDILKDNVAKKIFIDEFIKGGYAQGIHPSSSMSEINKYIENGVDWIEGDNLIEFLEENDYDYDGLVINEGSDSVADGTGNKAVWRGFSYVTFNSNQAKNVENLNPTADPDVRYSRRSSDVDLEKNAIKNRNDESVKFSLRSSVEETKGLVAVHNMTVDELQKSLLLGGLPMPSIAIIKAKRGHSEYGDVSLVFDKNVIDPKVDKNNKVYGGDAWTPVYPKIEYKVNDKVAKRISDTYYEVYEKYGSDEARPLYNYTYDLENQLNSSDGEVGLINKLKDDERLMQLYLLQNGNQKIEPITKEIVTELSADEVEMYNYLIALLGENIVSEFITPEGEKPLDYRKEYFSKYGEQIENAYKQLLKDNYHFSQDEINNVVDNMRKYDFVNLMKRTYMYHKHGKKTVKTETDYTATSRAIREAVKDSNYNQWIDSLFNGVEEKSGIRNNADYFTSSGNRRSWEALHWVNNLENVVKVMKAQNNGVAAFFSGHGIWAVSTKNYRSIDEIKADSDRLKNMPQEQYNSIKEDFGMRFNEIAMSIMDKSERNQFIAIDNAMQCIIDAVRRSKTKSGILRELKQYRQLDVTETAVDDIITLVSDIANMPTEYFEAKPQRAVKLEEVATAIVPDNISDALKKELIKYKIDFVEYETGNEESRLSALNSLTDIQFSHRSTQFENEGEEDTSNFTHRELLRNALSTVAQNDTERDFLARYQREIKDVEKKYEEVAKLRRQIHDISFTKGSDRSQLPAIKNRVAILEDQIQRTDKKLLQLEATKALNDVVEREKKTAVKKANERNKQTFERYKSRKRSSEVREKIKKLHKKIVKSLLYPTDSNYIPSDLAKSMIDVCMAIDFSTDRTAPDGGKTKAQEKRESITKALEKLKDHYEELEESKDDLLKDAYDIEIRNELRELVKTSKVSRIGEMSETQLNAVYQSLKSIYGTLLDAKKMIGTEEGRAISEIGLGIIEEQRQIDRKKKGVKKLGQKYSDLIAWNTVSPMRNFLRISDYDKNSELYQLAEQLNEGQRKKDIFVMESHKMFEHLVEGKENKKKYQDAIGKAHDFGIVDVDGNAVEMSKMTAMQLVMSWEREMASDGKHSHLQQSGAIIPNHKLLMNGKVSEAVSAEHAQRIDVNEDLIKDIVEQFDDWDTEYMEVAHKFFDEKSKNALNETSRVVSHRDVALSEKYIPYNVDEDFVFKKEISDENHIRPTLLSMGILKDTVRNAGQPLVMTSLNHVLDTQIEQVGAYYGLAIPLRNFNKVWNFTSDNRISVRESITKNWGKNGMSVIDQAIRDLQADRVKDRDNFINKALNTANSAFVRSVLNSNISVTLKQLSALPSAYSVLNQRFVPGAVYGHFLKMCVPAKYNKTIEEIDNYTAAHWLRRQGLSSQELGDIAKSMGKMKRFNDWLPVAFNPTKWIQGMDCLVTASFWDMCKKDIRKQGEFKEGSEEFMQAVADLYNRVIEDTQAVYDTLHRPEVLKTTNALTRQIFMFRSESLQHSGILYEKYGAMLANKNKETVRDFAKTAYAQYSSAMSFAILSLVGAALPHKMNPYRDEDEELTPESIIAELLNDLTNVLADLVMPIGGAQLQEFIYGKISGNKYSDGSLSVPAVDFINDFIDSVSTLNNAITAEEPDDGKIIKAVEDLTFKFAGLFGVPADNAKNIIKMFILHVDDAVNGEFGSFEAGVDRSNTVNCHRAVDTLLDSDLKPDEKSKKYNAVWDDFKENYALSEYDKKYDELSKKQQLVVEDEFQKGMINQIKEMYLNEEVDKSTVTKLLVDYMGVDDANDAKLTPDYWTAKENEPEEEKEVSEPDYLERVKTKLKFLYSSGKVTREEAEKILLSYETYKSEPDKVHWLLEQWDYENKNPDSETAYSKYNEMYTAIENGASNGDYATIDSTVKALVGNHGIEQKDISQTITSKFKSKYIELYKNDQTKAADFKVALLTAYVAAGYDRNKKSKDIDAWLKDS